MSNTQRIDHNEIQTQLHRDRMELMDDAFKSFDEQRKEMIQN